MHVIYGLRVNVLRQNNKFESDWLICNSSRDLNARGVLMKYEFFYDALKIIRTSNLHACEYIYNVCTAPSSVLNKNESNILL
jgi:hypothetical protein